MYRTQTITYGKNADWIYCPPLFDLYFNSSIWLLASPFGVWLKPSNTLWIQRFTFHSSSHFVVETQVQSTGGTSGSVTSQKERFTVPTSFQWSSNPLNGDPTTFLTDSDHQGKDVTSPLQAEEMQFSSKVPHFQCNRGWSPSLPSRHKMKYPVL